MCSSICREFGLAGDWRNQANGRLAVVPALEQIVEAAAMRVRQWFGQGVVDAPVSTVIASALARSTALRAGRMTDCRRRCPIKALASTMPLSVCIASSVSIWTACR